MRSLWMKWKDIWSMMVRFSKFNLLSNFKILWIINLEEEVEEFDDSYVENEDDYYNEWDDYGTSGEKYGYYNGYSDDVIDDAFDGCPEATWNVDW